MRTAPRQWIEKIPGVMRTWVEHERGPGQWSLGLTLVVEVDFPTDPGEHGHKGDSINQIESAVFGAQQNPTVRFTSLRIVPAAG